MRVNLMLWIMLLSLLLSCGGDAPPEPRYKLQGQLPPDVVSAFYLDFYDDRSGACPRPPIGDLAIAETWSGQGNNQILFTPPATSPLVSDNFYLVVVGEPSGLDWRFDSTLVGLGEKSPALHIDSSLPDQVTDATEWCLTGIGMPLSSVLRVEASNVAWTIHLISTGDGGQPLSESVEAALAEFYHVCPPLPPVSALQVTDTWTSINGASRNGASRRPLRFQMTPPHYFLAVKFEPDEPDWYFTSAVTGQFAGPSVSSKSGKLIDFIGVCPLLPQSEQLEIEAEGGEWTIYAISASPAAPYQE